MKRIWVILTRGLVIAALALEIIMDLWGILTLLNALSYGINIYSSLIYYFVSTVCALVAIIVLLRMLKRGRMRDDRKFFSQYIALLITLLVSYVTDIIVTFAFEEMFYPSSRNILLTSRLIVSVVALVLTFVAMKAKDYSIKKVTFTIASIGLPLLYVVPLFEDIGYMISDLMSLFVNIFSNPSSVFGTLSSLFHDLGYVLRLLAIIGAFIAGMVAVLKSDGYSLSVKQARSVNTTKAASPTPTSNNSASMVSHDDDLDINDPSLWSD